MTFRDSAELRQAVMFLHDNGILLHYEDCSGLKVRFSSICLPLIFGFLSLIVATRVLTTDPNLHIRLLAANNRSIDWLIDWLVIPDWLCLFDWLIDWWFLIDCVCLIDWLIGDSWLIVFVRLIDWLIDYSELVFFDRIFTFWIHSGCAIRWPPWSPCGKWIRSLGRAWWKLMTWKCSSSHRSTHWLTYTRTFWICWTNSRYCGRNSWRDHVCVFFLSILPIFSQKKKKVRKKWLFFFSGGAEIGLQDATDAQYAADQGQWPSRVITGVDAVEDWNQEQRTELDSF